MDARGPQAGTQVVASPVDTFVDQGMGQKMSRLNNLLESGKDFLAAYDANETKEGAQDAALGKEMKKTVLGSYEKGWLGVRGALSGAEDLEKVKASFANGFDRTAPGGIEKWLQDRHQELTKGMQEGPYAEAYRAQLAKGFTELRLKHFEEQKDAVVAQHENDVVKLLVAGVKNKTDITPEDFATVRKTLKEQGMGMDDKRFDQLGKNALDILAGDGNVQAIRAARKAMQDGSNAFPTIAEEQMEALEDKAATVKIQKHEQVRRAIKEEHEQAVLDAVAPIIKLAQSGGSKEAQSQFDALVQSRLFDHDPKSIELYQKMLVSVADKSDTLEQNEKFNDVTLNILTKGWGLREIQASGLTPKLLREAYMTYDRKHREDREAAAANRAAASAGRAAAAAEKALLVTSSREFSPAVKDALGVLPEPPKLRGDYVTALAKKQHETVRQIRADTESQLVKMASQRGTDMDGWRQDVVRIRENAQRRIERALDAKDPKNIPDYRLRFETWAEYLHAAKSGHMPADVAELEEAHALYKQQPQKK